MDFLDPKAKRRHTIRLYIGYGLMATLILTASAILVFQAYGFDLDRKTGEVIQNGLVFVDSAPDKANVYFNDDLQKAKTNNRFSLPSGDYTLKIQKDGYRDWHRTFSISGGAVERFSYPLLLPTKLEPREIQTFDLAPTFVTQSPDRRWTLVNQANSLTNFTEYDFNALSATENKPQTRSFVLPNSLFTAAPGDHAIELVEWSTDNKHLLVKHTFTGGNEFVIIARDAPETSININRLLAQNPTTITLRDKKFDQWYLYTQTGGILQTADAKKAITTILTGVITYKSHDDSTLLYSTLTEDGKKQRIILRQDNNTYTIKEVTSGTTLLDIARYDGKWRVVIGSDAEQKTYIYTDPAQILDKKDGSVLVPESILKTNGPLTALSFSQNTRFIVTQSGQHFEIFDAEYKQTYKYDIADGFDPGSRVTWMDGNRLTGRSAGAAFIFDFDGSNQQPLTTSLPNAPLLFNRDYTVLYTVDKATTVGRFSVFDTQLRLPGDR